MEGLILKLKPPDVKKWLIGKDPDAGKDWRQEEKGTTEDGMVGRHHWLNGHEFEQALGVVVDRDAKTAAVHGVAKSRTQLSDWTDWYLIFHLPPFEFTKGKWSLKEQVWRTTFRKWGSDGMRKRRGGALRNLTFISQIPSLLLSTLLYALKTHLIGSLTLWTPRELSQKGAEQEIRERKIRASVSWLIFTESSASEARPRQNSLPNLSLYLIPSLSPPTGSSNWFLPGVVWMCLPKSYVQVPNSGTCE